MTSPEKVEVAESKTYKVWYIYTFTAPPHVNMEAYANILRKDIASATARIANMLEASGGELDWDIEEV